MTPNIGRMPGLKKTLYMNANNFCRASITTSNLLGDEIAPQRVE
jgi:hypothetical protein